MWREGWCSIYGMYNDIADVESGPPYPPGTFDRVMLDAPCSALGQRPALYSRASLSEIRSFPPLQRKLFTQVKIVILLHVL